MSSNTILGITKHEPIGGTDPVRVEFPTGAGCVGNRKVFLVEAPRWRSTRGGSQDFLPRLIDVWALSSVGRATRLHRVGQRFESSSAHKKAQLRFLERTRSLIELNFEFASNEEINQ